MTAVRRLFSEGFRIFFLAACVFALVSLAVWEVWLAAQAAGGLVELPTAALPTLWHAHEMVFGYAGATLGGFLLTAVPGWVGSKAAAQRFILLVFLLWLAGRAAVWASGSLPAPLVALADLSYLPVLGWKVGRLLMLRPKPQQLVLLAVIAVVWTGNVFCHLDWLGLMPDGASLGVRAGLLGHAALIFIIGGRVVPGFTRNAMVQAGREHGHPRNPTALAVLSIAPALALPVAVLAGLPAGLNGTLALAAGAAGLVRLALWQGLWTVTRPILWTLHLASLMGAAGLIALGLAYLNIGSEIAALHLIGIGGIGGMTLSILSRATLGHTGRPLVAPPALALAYALLPLAALARFAGSTWPEVYYPTGLAAGALWLTAYGLTLATLLAAFLGPRLPRAPVERQPTEALGRMRREGTRA
ncbi:NnrS family protein [Rhodobacter sp. Har01]|uniref:NnrS family protein n=1 Tax=Rhodobacter sp. Har01 TaxID=2883999 RepID=UPI001D08A141|nr:NnrS family protein [Rhodobacter sp. Har01]MCB6177704.1 NnrS family protein [Rhodobacter sp. Har01]